MPLVIGEWFDAASGSLIVSSIRCKFQGPGGDRPQVLGLRRAEMERGNTDLVGTEVKNTRPDRMVCSCREWLAFERFFIAGNQFPRCFMAGLSGRSGEDSI